MVRTRTPAAKASHVARTNISGCNQATYTAKAYTFTCVCYVTRLARFLGEPTMSTRSFQSIHESRPPGTLSQFSCLAPFLETDTSNLECIHIVPEYIHATILRTSLRVEREREREARTHKLIFLPACLSSLRFFLSRPGQVLLPF